MPGKLNLRAMMGLAAALAFAGLPGPASAQTNSTDPACEQYVKNQYCPAYWQSQGFPSQAACVEHYTPQCSWVYTYEY